MNVRAALSELQLLFPKERLLTEVEDTICHSYDATRSRSLPDAVVIPENEAEVQQVVRCCAKHQVPVIGRGAGSGFVGAATPLHGGIVLLFTRMNRILHIDEENFTARVQPGVVTAELQREVRKRGLFYPPDPASLKVSTIGGNVAMGSGGPSAVKYGVTKDYVLAGRIVLPDGELLTTGIETMKGVVGYDLLRLFVGSEGTLGLFTEILLKLLPAPASKGTMTASFKNLDACAETVVGILHAGITPSTMEFIDKSALDAIMQSKVMTPKQMRSFNNFEGVEGLLLIEVDGEENAIQQEAERIRQICLTKGCSSFQTASSEEEAQNLWKVRRSISPAVGKLKPTKINEDITVPRSRLPELIRGVKKIAEKYRLLIVCFGHAGDGNIHVNIMTDRENREEYPIALQAVEAVFDLTLSLHGTISGEHGIGTAKQPYIGKELSEKEIKWMKALKKLFDPHNIMNPGKIFP